MSERKRERWRGGRWGRRKAVPIQHGNGWRRAGGKVEGGIRDKREPQQSFIRAAMLFGHPRWPWKWEDILPSDALLQPRQWILCIADKPTPSLVLYLWKKHYRLEYRSHYIEKDVESESDVREEKKVAGTPSTECCRPRPFKPVKMSYKLLWANLSKWDTSFHSKEPKTESLPPWNQLHFPAQPVLIHALCNFHLTCFCSATQTRVWRESSEHRFSGSQTECSHTPELLAFGK